MTPRISRAERIAGLYVKGALRALKREDEYRNAARLLPPAYKHHPARLHPTYAWRDLAGRCHVVLVGRGSRTSKPRATQISFWAEDLKSLLRLKPFVLRTLSPDPTIKPSRFVELTNRGLVPPEWVRLIAR